MARLEIEFCRLNEDIELVASLIANGFVLSGDTGNYHIVKGYRIILVTNDLVLSIIDAISGQKYHSEKLYNTIELSQRLSNFINSFNK